MFFKLLFKNSLYCHPERAKRVEGPALPPQPLVSWIGFVLLALLCIAGSVPARADYALLANGFRLRVERQESHGASVRLFLPGGGYVEVKASELLGFEKEEAPPPPSPPPPQQPQPEPMEVWESAGRRQGLDPVLLQSLIAEESNFNARAVSPKGAVGLMQLLPSTARQLNVNDIFDTQENVNAGARYLRSLLDRYRGDLAQALAAYNAGPDVVDRYRGIPPYRETREYVRRVITRFNREKTSQK